MWGNSLTRLRLLWPNSYDIARHFLRAGHVWFCIHPFTGCPNASYYGDNCSTPCNQNCFEGWCDIVDDSCLGCVPGYPRLTCDTGWDA